MFKLAAFVFAISLSWYLFAYEAYGKQAVSIGNRSEMLQESVVPELTKERIELLRRIADTSAREDRSSVGTSHNKTSSQINSINKAVASSAETKSRSTSAIDWNSSQHLDQYSGARKGFAFSGWTYQSRSLNWPDDIQASLVASCNSEGEKSLYIKMSNTYPFSGSRRGSYSVDGLVGWDSSTPYGAPFTYDARLNALRLQAGLEDSLSMVRDGKKVTIHIPWYNDKHAAFEFSLQGSSNALRTAFNYCTTFSS